MSRPRWPLHLRRRAGAEQAGLIRCYLRALAARNTGGLQAVSENALTAKATRQQFSLAADSQAGTATAAVVRTGK